METSPVAFQKMLQDGEELLYTIKPNKRRFVLANNVFSLVTGTIFLIPFFLIPIFGLLGVIQSDEKMPFFVFLGFAILFFLILYSSVFFNGARYKKTVYGVTNQRLLIQEGAISMSYRSYDLADIASIDVRIGFLDRYMKPETGSLCFFTVATAVNYNSNQNGRYGGPKACIFQAVEDPYTWYKRINDLKVESDRRK